MGWHDSMIHGISFNADGKNFVSDFILDIDYIFKWVTPEPPSEYCTFFVAPCTLVFSEFSNLKIGIETGRILPIELEIADLTLVEEREITEMHRTKFWKIETHSGDILFEATGFNQYVRQYPKHTNSQQLTMEERGGISFEKRSFTKKH